MRWGVGSQRKNTWISSEKNMKSRKNEAWSFVRNHKVYGQALGIMAIFNYIRFIGLEVSKDC